MQAWGRALEPLQGLQPGTGTPPFGVSVPVVEHTPQEMGLDFADEKR